MFGWYMPLDPDCPTAPDIGAFLADPMTVYSGCGDELVPVFENHHRAACRRCQEYGLANIEQNEADRL